MPGLPLLLNAMVKSNEYIGVGVVPSFYDRRLWNGQPNRSGSPFGPRLSMIIRGRKGKPTRWRYGRLLSSGFASSIDVGKTECLTMRHSI